ncbi:MAG: DUF899 family protein [Steroidobacteraceae bacterium]
MQETHRCATSALANSSPRPIAPWSSITLCSERNRPSLVPCAGGQDSTVSVFTRGAKGVLRHYYTAHPRMAPDIQQRGIDLLAPIWHFMDLTPQGRGNWYASLSYGTKVPTAGK